MIRKTSIFYSLSSIFKSGVQMIVGLAIAKFVTPEDYGIWGVLNLFLTYSVILQMGIVNGVNLELPIAVGKQNHEKAKNIVQTSQTYITICIFLVFIIGAIYLLIFGGNLSVKFFWGVIALIFLAALTFYQNLLSATYRTPESFRKLSYINIAHGIANLLAILLIVYFSFYGLLAKAVLVLLIYVICLHSYRPFKVRFNFNKEQFKELIKIGLPIFILSYIQAFAISFDRILLVNFTNLNSVGIYTFAYLAFSSITVVSTSVASYIYPTMSHMYAESKDKVQLWSYVKKNIIYIFSALLFIGICGSLVAPFIINSYFPNYSSSIDIMKILFFAGVFNGGVIGVNVLLSIKKWNFVVIYHLLFALLLIVCPLISMNIFINKLHGVAYGVLFANILNFFSAYILVYVALIKQKRK